MNDYLGDVGLILLLFVLLIVGVPLLIGMGISYILGVTGLKYYALVIVVASIIWLILGRAYYH